MTEKENKEPVFSPDEIKEMFDHGFLKNISEIAHRAKERDIEDLDVKFFHVSMSFQFNCGEMIHEYDQIKDRINLKIQPITQEDIDRAKDEVSQLESEE